MKRILIALALLMAVVAVQAQKISYIETTSSWHYVYDEKGKKLHTFSVSNVGGVLSATGDTFTSRKGSWIYTWDKNGKKLATRYSQH